ASLPGSVAARRQEGVNLGGAEPACFVPVLNLPVGSGVAAPEDGKLFVQVEGGADPSAVAPAEKGAGQAESVPDRIVRQDSGLPSAPSEHLRIRQGRRGASGEE
ncbi:MAG TPA: hypothetical protein VK988_00870, partial [Acidimicrobiales bacterium]|nr:hypothetical protein [Acidimicrobiales bacterium]